MEYITNLLNQAWLWLTNHTSQLTLIVTVIMLIYVVISNRSFMKKVIEQINLLQKQTEKISEQTELLRKQVFGEIYPEAQVKDLRFFLPEREKHSANGFEKAQKDKEIPVGKEIKIPKEKEVELHLQWWMEKGQHLRIFSIGFLDSYEGKEYKGHPEIPRLTRSFIKGGDLGFRDVKDWHGHWTTEYPSRYVPEEECVVTSFEVIGKNVGKYPLAVHIAVNEAPKPKREILWVEVVDGKEFEEYIQELKRK